MSCIYSLHTHYISLFFCLLLMLFFFPFWTILFLSSSLHLTQMSVHTDCTWLWYFLFPSFYFHCRLFFPSCGVYLFPPSILLFLCSPCPPCGLFFSLYICPFLHLFLPISVPIFSHPSPPSILSHLPSLPTIGKWGVARVLVWTGTPLGAAALPGPNSLAPVVMWTSSRLPWQQHHLPRSPPSTPIRKMDKPPLNAFLIGRMHSRDRLSNTGS